uniref:Uncharacterized protein n=1 Tax=Anguilla anguilla TaxID=7936 RepID=A0A0E9XJ83_ANGAN
MDSEGVLWYICISVYICIYCIFVSDILYLL